MECHSAAQYRCSGESITCRSVNRKLYHHWNSDVHRMRFDLLRGARVLSAAFLNIVPNHDVTYGFDSRRKCSKIAVRGAVVRIV